VRACRETRSLLNPAMLSTLNRGYELELHLRAALRDGYTKADIHEVQTCARFCEQTARCGNSSLEVFYCMGTLTGFHSLASLCASAICAGVIFAATKLRNLMALARNSVCDAREPAAARLAPL
jgi:hypothetical protein